MVQLDLIFARGQLSYKMNGSRPEIRSDGCVTLRHARHPLLDSAKAVPIEMCIRDSLCGEYGLTFWDLRWENAAAFTFTLTRRDWKRLRRLTAKLDCELTPLGWRGTPFFLGRMRYRYGLWVTLGLCSLLLLWGCLLYTSPPLTTSLIT